MFNSSWYLSLNRPQLAPPDWVFSPMWSFLYVTIFLALVIYFFADSENKKAGYRYFFIQLFLNFIWTPIFFGFKNILCATVVIILLDIFLYLTIRKFYTVSKLAGLILLPYMLWVLFATYLNIGYLILN